MTAATRRMITLPDGRGLAYAEYGTPGGRPIMLFPGTPGSHILGSLAHAPALARGLRVIAPDRPGIGHSDDLPGRRFTDWPGDVACLADALGFERFAVVGISGGGPYALACASRLGERVTRVALVSSPGPFDEPGAFAGMALGLRSVWALIRRAPLLARPILRGAAAAVARYPDRALMGLQAVCSESDRAVLRRADFRALFRPDTRETLRAGARGATRDLALYATPWDFAPATVSQRVLLWHGEADRIIPVGQARRLAATLAACEPVFVPDAGHFWFVDHLEPVLDAIAAEDR